jgi:Mg-chelatase subunit ChlD
MKRIVKLCLAGALAVTAAATAGPTGEVTATSPNCPTLVINYSYRTGLQGNVVRGQTITPIPGLANGQAFVSDAGTLKALFLINAANAIMLTLQGYERGDQFPHPSLVQPLPAQAPASDGPRTVNGIPVYPYSLPEIATPTNTEERKTRFAKALQENTDKLRAAYRSQGLPRDARVTELFDNMEKLAANISTNYDPHSGGGYRYDNSLEVLRGGSRGGFEMSSLEAISTPSVTLQSGGAQDAGVFWTQVKSGNVPSSETLTVDGFLKEFQIPLAEEFKPEQLVSARPGVIYDPATGLLYTQVQLEVKPDEALTRRPTNLVLAIDRSGSMSAKDGTTRTRLEWAKLVATKILTPPAPGAAKDNYLRLTDQDAMGLVVFDHGSKIEIPSARLTPEHREKILQAIGAIELGGSTDVLKAMLQSFGEIDKMNLELGMKAEGYDNRVLMFTDCGNNTGSDDRTLVAEVANAAARGNAVTIIGLGEDLHQQLSKKLGETRGGFYYFAGTGQYLDEFLSNGNTRLSPFAYDFMASVNFQNLPVAPRVVRVFGVNEDPRAPRNQVINIPTLRVSDEAGGGGGIVIVYDTRPVSP